MFVLDGIQSVSARDRILRVVVSNILAHTSFDEGDVFKNTIPLKNIATAKVGPNSESSTQDGTQNLQEMHQKIIIMIQQNNKITRKDMARELSIGTRTLQRILNEMGNVRYFGSGYSGHWEIQ